MVVARRGSNNRATKLPLNGTLSVPTAQILELLEVMLFSHKFSTRLYPITDIISITNFERSISEALFNLSEADFSNSASLSSYSEYFIAMTKKDLKLTSNDANSKLLQPLCQKIQSFACVLSSHSKEFDTIAKIKIPIIDQISEPVEKEISLDESFNLFIKPYALIWRLYENAKPIHSLDGEFDYRRQKKPLFKALLSIKYHIKTQQEWQYYLLIVRTEVARIIFLDVLRVFKALNDPKASGKYITQTYTTLSANLHEVALVSELEDKSVYKKFDKQRRFLETESLNLTEYLYQGAKLICYLYALLEYDFEKQRFKALENSNS